jgi:hypothetical protein
MIYFHILVQLEELAKSHTLLDDPTVLKTVGKYLFNLVSDSTGVLTSRFTCQNYNVQTDKENLFEELSVKSECIFIC